MSDLPIPASRRGAPAGWTNSSRGLARNSRGMTRKPAGAVFCRDAREESKILPREAAEAGKRVVETRGTSGPEVDPLPFLFRSFNGNRSARRVAHSQRRVRYDSIRTKCAMGHADRGRLGPPADRLILVLGKYPS